MKGRYVNVSCGQLGPVQLSHSREEVVRRLVELMREAKSRGSDVIVFPELALTTFFPRWVLENEERIDSFFEKEMPDGATVPLFDEAKRLGIGFYLGYGEIEVGEVGTKKYYNTSIIVGKSGEIVGKYRKIHLPGHFEPQPNQKSQHLEKRYFAPGNLGFNVWNEFGGIVGMCICNDRRWPETYRVMGLQGVELILIGYNTPDDHTGVFDFDVLTPFHHRLSLQAGAYQNATWIAAAAKAGCEEGSNLIGDSMIVAPSGEVVAKTVTTEDEVISARCDLELGQIYRRTIFDFERHREPDHYRLITTSKGVVSR